MSKAPPSGGRAAQRSPKSSERLSLTAHVIDVLAQLRQARQPADSLLGAHFKAHRALGPRERNAISDACFAVLRERTWFTHLAKDGPGDEAARARRLAMLALVVTGTAVTDASPDELAWLQTASQKPKPSNADDPMRHNLPQWLAQRLHAQMGDAVWPLAQALLVPAPLDLRVNTMLAKRAQVAASLAQAGFDSDETPYSPWGLRMRGKPKLMQSEAHAQGLIEVQDEGSQLLAVLMDPRRGDMVTDFCAGAGGKTLAMAAQMRGQGRVYALDTASHRLDALQPRAKRAGVANLYPIAIAHEADERLQRLTAKMDRVLVDAPCTGLGTLRRSPDRKWRLTADEAATYPELQTRILAAAARLVKPGGRLVYATCSLLREENEDIAQAFDASHADFLPVPVQAVLEKAKIANAASLCSVLGDTAHNGSGSDEYLPEKYLRLWPHLHGTDGFFAAVWQRKA